MTVTEEILHSDVESDVKLCERRYPSATLERCCLKDAENLDVVIDVSCDRHKVSEIRLLSIEESTGNLLTNEDEVLEMTFQSFEKTDKCEAKILDITASCDVLSSTQTSITSLAPSCTSMASLTSTEIRKELLLYGQSNIGPILPMTRRTYLIRLKKLRQGKVQSPKTCLANFDCGSLKKLGSLIELDNQMSRKFVRLAQDTKISSNFLTRDGVVRSSFNYLLMDPQVTANLPLSHVDQGSII